MRCISCTLALGLAIVFSGCRTQTATLTNPFLAPDRVPPPQTRAPIPGTAQPYYPGDPVPNTQPAVNPPGTVPAYAPQGPPVVPQGGWNAPQSGANYSIPTGDVLPASAEMLMRPGLAAGEQPVRVQVDEQNIRFGLPAAPTFAVDEPPITPASAVTAPQPTYPAVYQSEAAPEVTPAPVYPGQLVDYQVPVADPRPVRLRAVHPGQPLSADGSVTSLSRDGFRPQGSNRDRSALRPESSANSSGYGVASEAADRFGFDPNYGWLRGQLEFSEASGQWKLRYIPIQQTPDQFGGSVLIANPQVLGGVRPGEHVLLRGQLQSRNLGGQAFVPIYNVSIVQRQQI
jgi:hypothetical protein